MTSERLKATKVTAAMTEFAAPRFAIAWTTNPTPITPQSPASM